MSCPDYLWGTNPGEFVTSYNSTEGGPGWGPYAYNVIGSRLDDFPNGLGADEWAGFPPYFVPIREPDVRAPAELYALGDAPVVSGLTPSGRNWVTNLAGTDYGNIWYGQPIAKVQHSQLLNMLFADGHVAGVHTNILFSTNALYLSKWNHDNQP